jgi:hypothetical protein
MKKWIGFIVAILAIHSHAYAAQPHSLGSVNINGIMQFAPASQTVSTTTVIIATAPVVILQSTGSVINMAGFGSVNQPVVSTSTALNGQMLILISTNSSSASVVIVTSGTSSGLHLGAATRTIQQNSVLTLIYNAALLMWQEVSYTGG